MVNKDNYRNGLGWVEGSPVTQITPYVEEIWVGGIELPRINGRTYWAYCSEKAYRVKGTSNMHCNYIMTDDEAIEYLKDNS